MEATDSLRDVLIDYAEHENSLGGSAQWSAELSFLLSKGG